MTPARFIVLAEHLVLPEQGAGLELSLITSVEDLSGFPDVEYLLVEEEFAQRNAVRLLDYLSSARVVFRTESTDRIRELLLKLGRGPAAQAARALKRDAFPEYQNIISLNEILACEASAESLVAVVATNLDHGDLFFKEVMRTNLLRGLSYRYLLLSGTDQDLESELKRFITDLDLGTAHFDFQARAIRYRSLESEITLIDPFWQSRRGFILGDPTSRASWHFEIHERALFRLGDRFNFLWQEADETVL
jgi:hypothetical protein